MDTGNNTQPGDPGTPQVPRHAEAKKAAGWLGHVIISQVIAYFVRHWLP